MKYPENEKEFRKMIQDFLDTELTDELKEAGKKKTSVWQEPVSAAKWQAVLYKKGWVAPDWPEEYGGTGWSARQRYIFAQECARYGTPGIAPMGLKMCGPMLIGHGTKEQKDYYLPKILSGEHIWCQGYSEPGSGSDLASLKTSAVSDGDDYIVNGTKIWTSHAQHSNMIFALVRTSNEGRIQQGISFLLIDMKTKGIEIKPIINLEGSHELNQVWFNDVRVPKANRVGEENNGWAVAKYLLEFERFSMSSVELRRLLNRAKKLAKETEWNGSFLLKDPAFRSKIDSLEIKALAIEMSESRALASIESGGSPGSISSVLSAIGAETLQLADELGVELAAYYGLPKQPLALEVGHSQFVGPGGYLPLIPSFLNNRMRTIAGGSSEIQRNIIAKTILGL